MKRQLSRWLHKQADKLERPQMLSDLPPEMRLGPLMRAIDGMSVGALTALREACDCVIRREGIT